MPWIPDVAPYDTIQSLWGNSVRDRTMQAFTNKGERDSHTLPEGALCITLDTRIVYVKVGTAWWVVSMPWRSWTPTAYTTPPGGGAFSTLGPGGSGYWRQSMGACQAIAGTTPLLNLTNTDYWFYLSLPQTATFGGHLGSLRVYVQSRGLAYGGVAMWQDNNGPGGASRASVANVGAGVTPIPTINAATGSAQLSVDANYAFVCDPTVDTP